jgi:hypothetical protein
MRVKDFRTIDKRIASQQNPILADFVRGFPQTSRASNRLNSIYFRFFTAADAA